jgi:hypothetical protein
MPMQFNLFKRKEKIEDSIIGLNQHYLSKVLDFSAPDRRKKYKLEERIKKLEEKINKIDARRDHEQELVFKPIANRIAYLISSLSNTQPILVYNPPGGTGYSLEVNGVSKYRIFIAKSIGISLHTWKYKMPDNGFTEEYNRIEPVYIKINEKAFHDFSEYGSDEKLVEFLNLYCKAADG